MAFAVALSPESAGAECPPDIDTSTVESWLRKDPDRRFHRVLESPKTHRIQVLVTEVGRAGKAPCARRYGYRLESEYFYPASAIKVFAAVSTMLWFQERKKEYPRLSLDTPLQVEPFQIDIESDRIELSELTASRSLRTVVRDTLIRSSNSGFNWLYDVAGPELLYRPYADLGFDSLRVRHRLTSRAYPRIIQDYGPPISSTQHGKTRFLSPLRKLEKPLPPRPQPAPSVESDDFSDRNSVSLRDLQELLIALARPDLGRGDLGLTANSRRFLRRTLAVVVDDPPPEGAPSDRVRYKPMLSGLRRALGGPARVHIESKAGRAYGFIVDNAYVRDKKTGREIFVSAVIYANSNGVVGDDQYEYDTVSLPFFDALGELVGRTLLLEGD